MHGLAKLGKGNWRGISRHYVPSRTPTQVASHAQKHFLRLQGSTKRRSRFTGIEEGLATQQLGISPDLIAPGAQQLQWQQLQQQQLQQQQQQQQQQLQLQQQEPMALMAAAAVLSAAAATGSPSPQPLRPHALGSAGPLLPSTSTQHQPLPLSLPPNPLLRPSFSEGDRGGFQFAKARQSGAGRWRSPTASLRLYVTPLCS